MEKVRSGNRALPQTRLKRTKKKSRSHDSKTLGDGSLFTPKTHGKCSIFQHPVPCFRPFESTYFHYVYLGNANGLVAQTLTEISSNIFNWWRARISILMEGKQGLNTRSSIIHVCSIRVSAPFLPAQNYSPSSLRIFASSALSASRSPFRSIVKSSFPQKYHQQPDMKQLTSQPFRKGLANVKRGVRCKKIESSRHCLPTHEFFRLIRYRHKCTLAMRQVRSTSKLDVSGEAEEASNVNLWLLGSSSMNILRELFTVFALPWSKRDSRCSVKLDCNYNWSVEVKV